MLWFVLAITAMFLFALIGVIQGIAIKKYSLNGRKYLLYTMLLQGAISGLVFLFKPVTYYEFSFILLSISGGFFFVYGLLPYMKAVEFEEVSRLNPLFNLGPVFVFVLSIIFLETILSNSNFIGFIFLILGGILISIKKTKGFIKFSKGFWYMILTNLLLGFYFIITDYLFKRYDYWSVFAFIQLGIFISALSLILVKSYSINKNETQKLSKWAKILIISDIFLSILAVSIRNMAIKLNSATIVTSLSGIQSIFVLLLTLFLSVKSSYILREEIDKKTIFLKIVSLILLSIGVYLVAK